MLKEGFSTTPFFVEFLTTFWVAFLAITAVLAIVFCRCPSDFFWLLAHRLKKFMCHSPSGIKILRQVFMSDFLEIFDKKKAG